MITRPPLGANERLPLHAIESRIQRTLPDLQYALGQLLDAFGDPPAVHRAPFDRHGECRLATNQATSVDHDRGLAGGYDDCDVKAARIIGPAIAALTVVTLAARPTSEQDGRDSSDTSHQSRRVEMKLRAVPLDPRDPIRTRLGRFQYAGGLQLEALNTDLLHGLSDLRVGMDRHVVAVGDEGVLLEATLDLDPSGRLRGLSDVQLSPLLDTNGRALLNKQRADAEGLAVLPDGDRLISFERNHRIWLYPAKGGPPKREVPKPNARLGSNQGLEAITTYPAAGDDAYLVGAESGHLWTCHLAGRCQPLPSRALPGPGFGLSGMASYGATGVALLYRAYDLARGARVVLRLFDRPLIAGGAPVDELVLDRPLVADNFEGVAIVGDSDQMFRIYLLSDDNASAQQHTYLLAFDWQR